jgi:hypothetical protein
MAGSMKGPGFEGKQKKSRQQKKSIFRHGLVPKVAGKIGSYFCAHP